MAKVLRGVAATKFHQDSVLGYWKRENEAPAERDLA
jgi:hypothetical protein